MPEIEALATDELARIEEEGLATVPRPFADAASIPKQTPIGAVGESARRRCFDDSIDDGSDVSTI